MNSHPYSVLMNQSRRLPVVLRKFLIAALALLALALTLPHASAQTTVTIYANRDTELYNQGKNDDNNYGACADVWVGGDTSGGKGEDGSHGLFGFSLASIPANSTITSATLRLNAYDPGSDVDNTARSVSVHSLTQAWVEGTGDCNGNNNGSGATWKERSNNVDWTTDGGTFGGAVATTTVSSPGVYNWAITSLVQNWYSGATVNNGVLLKYVTTNANEWKVFRSREFATVNDRPRLIVTYQPICNGSVGGAVSTCQGTTANVTPSTGGIWGSSNTGIATVTNAGVVTGVSPGTVTLTYTQTSNGCQYTKTFSVIARPTLGGPTSVCQGLTANVTPATGGTWVSSNTGIATVTNAGLVTGVSAGTVTLTFTNTSTGCTNTRSFTVNALPSLGGATQGCVAGPTANVTPSTGGTWVSSNTSIATVSNAGVVTSVAAGTVTLTFTNTETGCTNTKGFTVNAPPALGGATSVLAGQTANVTPNTGGTWQSSNTAIATVTNAGLVTGVSAGNVTLTFTNSFTGCSATRSFTVGTAEANLAITKIVEESTCAIVGNQRTYRMNVTNTGPANATGVVLSDMLPTGHAYVSQQTLLNNVPTVNGSYNPNTGLWAIGNVAVGQTWSLRITVGLISSAVPSQTNTASVSSDLSDPNNANNSASVTINTSMPAGGVSGVCVGSSGVVTPGTGGTWASSNNAVATVSNSGVVNGLTAGTVTLTYTNTSTGCQLTRNVTVNALPVPGGPSVVCTNSTINVTPATGGTWSSGNVTVASVSNAGLVTGISGGTATLTYTNSTTGCSATKVITVTPAPSTAGAASVNFGETTQITPASGGTWSSSDTNIATVTNAGVVTGVGLGPVTLTFTDTASGCVRTKLMTVTPLANYLNTTIIDDLDQDDPNPGDNFDDEPVFPQQTNTLIVSVFFDNDGDGDADEPLQGIQVVLRDSEGNVVQTVSTAVNGLFTFENLPPGFYTVTQTVPNGTFTLYDNPIEVSVVNGQVTNADFVNSANGSISGTITANNGDDAQVGVLIALLDENGDPVLDSNNVPITTLTDNGGFYQFTNIPPGTYQVQQTVPSGFTAVDDVDGGDLTINGDITPIVILPGTEIVNMDFVNFEPGKILGNISIDTDVDLLGDAPHVSVTVVLLGASGNPVLDGGGNPITTETDVDGNYVFEGLDAGDYQVAQVVPTGFTAVGDSDGGDFTVVGDITLITIVEGAEGLANFTNQPQTDIQVTKTVNNPTPVIGTDVTFTVTVTNNGPNAANEVKVDDFGTGVNYVSHVASQGTFTVDPGSPLDTIQALWEVGALSVGQSATLTVIATVSDSPSVSAYNNTVVASSELGDPNPNNNEDDSPFDPILGSINGIILIDTTGDGIGDSPQVGVVVVLLDENGLPVLDENNDPVTTTTNNNGDYTFSNLPPGTYIVAQTPPNGFIAIDDVDGGDLTVIGDITPIALAGGQNLTGQDFTNTALGSIAGTVSLDNTGDNNGDAPINGVVVVLRDEFGNVVLNGNGDPITTNTDASGNYTFNGVTSGEYQVSIVPPSGLIAVNDVDGGDLTVIGDVNLITILPGQNLTGQDFVLSGLADLAVVKTVNNAAPIVGTSVTFDIVVTNNGPTAATGVIANDLLPSGYTLTGSTVTQGSYNEFSGIWNVGSLAVSGNATLTVTATVLGTGNYTNTVTVTGDQPDPDPTNNVDEVTPDPTPPEADLEVIKVVNNSTPEVDSEVIFTITATNNGPSNATGVTVTDVLPSGYTLVSAIPSIGTYSTINGVWTIGALANGSSVNLQITAVILGSGDYTNVATVTGNETDPDPTNNTDDETPVPNSREGSISGTVRDDMNCDEIGDIGIPGVSVELFDSGNVSIGTTVTAQDGSYGFSGLAAGSYKVVKTPLPGYKPIGDMDGGDLNANGDVTLIVLATGNTSVADQDFVDRFNDGFDPASDTDGDVFPPGQEYAFGGNPKRGDHLVMGTTRRAGMTIEENATGGIDISYVRFANRYDVIVVPYVSDDPRDPNKWTAVAAVPVVTDNGDDTETVKWANIHDIDGNPLVTRNHGFVRLYVEPCELDATWTLVQGWCRNSIDGKRQTYGVNFSSMPVFTGRVDSASGTVITTATSGNGQNLGTYLAGGPSFIEITDGTRQGHRFDIASGGINTFTLNLASLNNTLAALPAGLAGSHFVVRRHNTLGGIYPNAEWDASTTPGSADQVLLYSGSGYDTYYNSSLGNVWVKQGAGFSSQNALVIPPGTGMLVVHANPSDTNEMLAIGDLRYNDFIRPLKLGSSGLNFTALGFPFDASPASLNMTVANGFVAATSPGSSSQILNWVGDTVVNTTGWSTNYQLFAGDWRTVGNLTQTTTNSPLFRKCRGTLVDVQVDKLDWTHLRPWNPAPWFQPAP